MARAGLAHLSSGGVPVIIALSARQVKQLVDSYDVLATWIRDHAELCEEPDELKRVDRAHKKATEIINLLEWEVNHPHPGPQPIRPNPTEPSI